MSNDSERSEVGGKAIIPIGLLPVFTSLFPVGSAAAIEGRAAYVHEFGNVAQQVSAAFTGGNAFLVTGPTPNRDMLDYSVGLRVGSGPVQIDISYNALARSSYYQQVGLLRARVPLLGAEPTRKSPPATISRESSFRLASDRHREPKPKQFESRSSVA